MKKVVVALSLVGGLFLTVLHLSEDLPNVEETRTTVLTEVRPLETFESEENVIKTNQLSVKVLDLNRATTVLLGSEVNSYTANLVIKQIQNANKKRPGQPIYLLLDSPGGSVIDGARIISTMQASKSPVHTVCLQICASMAAMILEYGVERYAVDRSIIMFHPASIGGSFQGELDKVVSRFTFLQRYVDKMDHYAAKRSGQTYEQFKSKSSRELWIDAEDALEQHYIDSVVKVNLESTEIINFGDNKVREKLRLENYE
jgi:ATP-dependent Clp protease, protease subunit